MSCQHNTSMQCPCQNPCKHLGTCCACVANHVEKGTFPACFFSGALNHKGGTFEELVEDRAEN